MGGHCIAIDPWFIVAQNPAQARLDSVPAREVTTANLTALNQVLPNVGRRLSGERGGNYAASELKIACFGLAFKPILTILYESPAMEIAEMIARWRTRATRWLVEPNIPPELPAKLAGHCITDHAGRRAITADVLVLLVDHKEFKATSMMHTHQQYVAGYQRSWR